MLDRTRERKDRRKANAEQLQDCQQRFTERYPNDEAILEEIAAISSGGEHVCRNCGDPLPREYGSRSVRCVSCGKINWITAASFFKGVWKIRAWWGTVWLIANSGLVPKAHQISKWFGVALSTAQNILANISFWVADTQVKDENAEDLCSSLLRSIYSRRSIKTPADARPEQEQDEIEKLCPKATAGQVVFLPVENESIRDQLVTGTGAADIAASSGFPAEEPAMAEQYYPGNPEETSNGSSPEEVLMQSLSSEPAPLEQLLQETALPLPRLLSAITTLELDALIKVLPGNMIMKVHHKQPGSGSLSEATAETVASFIEFTKTHWQGFARKNVQLYLSMFWFYQSWPALGRNWLIRQICGARRLPREELVAFVSPLTLKFAAISSRPPTDV